MKIRRIRIVLPSRLRHEALATARLTGQEIASALGRQADARPTVSVRLADKGQPAPMLARDAGGAVASAFGQGRRR